MPRFVRFLPAILWMGLIFYFSSIPNLELTGSLSMYDFVVRKISHLVEYALLVIFLFYGFRAYCGQTRAVLLALLIAILYSISDELHQSFVPTREGKSIDVLIDACGSLFGCVLLQSQYGKNYPE